MNYPKPNKFSEVAAYAQVPSYISVPGYNYKIRVKKANKGKGLFGGAENLGDGLNGNSLKVGIGVFAIIAVAYYASKHIKKTRK